MRRVIEVDIGETPYAGDSYTDEGWRWLVNAVADMDLFGVTHDAVMNELTKRLPRDFKVPAIAVRDVEATGIDEWARRVTHAIYVENADLGCVTALLHDMWRSACA